MTGIWLNIECFTELLRQLENVRRNKINKQSKVTAFFLIKYLFFIPSFLRIFCSVN